MYTTIAITSLHVLYLTTFELLFFSFQVELARNTLDIMWGFSVEAELVENSDKQVKLLVPHSVYKHAPFLKGQYTQVNHGA